ncbi:hypothetical protein [Kribbella deserti]|uniref:Lipoprotein n=1 Tax=Kribbella deserti TaxID=1926257 RepID=A0ABV6QFG9_9ACTN
MKLGMVLAVVAALLGMTGCAARPAPMDVHSLRGYVATYLELLQEKDEAALRLHLGNLDEAPDDAGRRLAVVGGEGWRLAGVSWSSIARQDLDVTIAVDGPKGRRDWRQRIRWIENRWRMTPLPLDSSTWDAKNSG